jgi:hypothetical protein
VIENLAAFIHEIAITYALLGRKKEVAYNVCVKKTGVGKLEHDHTTELLKQQILLIIDQAYSEVKRSKVHGK